jgi:peptidoglycan-associated lipoprotein
MPTALRPVCLLVAAALCAIGAEAQSAAPATSPSGRVSLALTYDVQGSNLTTSSSFWLQGGAGEVNMRVYRGLGFTVSVMGVHTGNSGGGVPVSVITETFGPSYTFTRPMHSHSVSFFARGLLGEANGFNGVYPAKGGPLSSSDSLAAVIGGGVDIRLSHHLGLRVVQADYVRTQFPNSLENVQNNFRIGAGIILH